MNYNEAIAFLTRCADDQGIHWYQGRPWGSTIETCPICHGSNDAGWLATPCSRYGHTSAHIAPLVYRVAKIDGDTSESKLDYWMELAVNDSELPQDKIESHAISLSGADIDSMVRGYLDCQLWAQIDYERSNADTGDGPKLDANYSLDDIADEYVEKVETEFRALVTEHPLAVRMYLNWRATRHAGRNGQIVLIRDTRPAYDSSQFGHDFYLTRERHGTGFWDRGLGTLGDYLTDVAHWAGSAETIVYHRY